MTQEFDPLKILLTLLSTDPALGELPDVVSHLDPGQWDTLVSEAYRQDLGPLLYSFLVRQKEAFTLPLPIKEKLNRTYLSTAVRNTLALHETEILLTAFQNVDIPAAGLKGIYLLENVYADIGARSMNDIDILIRKQDLAACISTLQGLGYTSSTYFSLEDKNVDTKHLPPMQKSGGMMVEVHWTLLEEDEPFTIDAEALWVRTVPAKIANVDALTLGVEDLILHLCLHLTYQHYLNLGLRGLLDIAMVINKFKEEIDWQKLVEIAKSWRNERVTALTLRLVETQLNIPIPAEVFSSLLPEGIDHDLLENARLQLLDRVRFDDHFTPDLVSMSASKNPFSKIKIGLQRVFISRLALARTYNVPPNLPKILGYYYVRLKYLITGYGKTVLRLQLGEKSTEPARQKAEISKSLHEWMTQRGE